MLEFGLIIVGLIAASLYCILFAIILDLIVRVDFDISPYLIVGYFCIVVTIILVSLKVLLVVA
jgi:hypothetical protein